MELEVEERKENSLLSFCHNWAGQAAHIPFHHLSPLYYFRKPGNVTVVKRLWDWNWKMGQQSLGIHLFWYVRHPGCTAQQLPSSFLSVVDACVRQGSRSLQNCLFPLIYERWWLSMPFFLMVWTPPLQGWTKFSQPKLNPLLYIFESYWVLHD